LGEDGLLHLKDSAGAVTDVGGGGDITTDAAWAAKGDLIVGTGNDTASVLTAGTDDYVLTADSGETTGLKWAAAAGGGAVATDTIWDAAGDLAVGSGANTAAKLSAGAAGGVLAMGNSAVIWNAGTSFPASKATGDRYWRTDLSMEYFWNGTYWLSTQLFSIDLFAMYSSANMTIAGISANDNIARSGSWVADADMWLVDWIQLTRVLTTNDGTKYWTLTLEKANATPATSTVASFTTAAHTMGQFVLTKTAIGALIGTTYLALQTLGTKTSTPGTLIADGGTVRFRLLGT
jgi:hypothetical protein